MLEFLGGGLGEPSLHKEGSPHVTALTANSHQTMSAETILIVRPGALGDTILSLPLLASIRSEYPDARITFLGNSSYKDLLPGGMEFQSIDASQWLWLFGSSTQKGPSRIFDRAYVILNRADEVARCLMKTVTECVLTAPSTPRPGKHVVESLHEALAFPVPPKYPALMELAPSEKSDLIWIHPGSGGPKKCVPLEFIVRLAEFLRCRTGLDLAVTTGEADDFLKDLPEWKKLINAPRTYLLENRPLLKLSGELGGARLFIGNDSGISHLAASLGAPSVVFFTSSDPIQWAPWTRAEKLRIMDCRGRNVFTLDLEREAREILALVDL
jgi:heptosyltransferase-3